MLALGLFIHNAIITIVSNNKHPENNVKEIKIFLCWNGANLFSSWIFSNVIPQ